MPRTLAEAKITTANARKALKPGVHWHELAHHDVHLGYRKGTRGGTWLVRWRAGKGYKQRPLGPADDQLSEGTLDYREAAEAAKITVELQRRKARATADGPLLTVRLAIEAYVQGRDERERKRNGRPIRSDACSRLGRYVVGAAAKGKRKAIAAAPLADLSLHDLTESDLADWRAALPAELKAATKRRLVNDLKAALNGAYKRNRARLPAEFPATVKHGLEAPSELDDAPDEIARDNQILPDGHVARLIGAAREVDAELDWDGDLFRLVIVLAATGARFSQAKRLRVGDVQAGALMVPASRKGRGEKATTTRVPIGPDVQEALQPAITGRPKDGPLLERWRSKQLAGSIQWQRAARGAWQSSSEISRAWAVIRQRAELPGVIPYALRHSSIVRGIRANLPIRLVAALHDTSVAMIERHYGRWVADGLDELAARSVVPLVPPDGGSNVVPIAR